MAFFVFDILLMTEGIIAKTPRVVRSVSRAFGRSAFHVRMRSDVQRARRARAVSAVHPFRSEIAHAFFSFPQDEISMRKKSYFGRN